MDWNNLAPILQAIAWPVAVIVVFIVLRRQFADIVKTFGNRVTALGIGKFSIELERAKATAFSVNWEIGKDDARHLTSSAIFDSASSDLFDQIARSRPSDYSIIDLEGGTGWLTSRLFIFATILGALNGARVFVFVESKGYQHHVYVGHATLDVVRDVLARAFPWFDAALLNAANTPVPRGTVAEQRPEVLSLGNCDLNRLASIVQSFVADIQRVPGTAGDYKDKEWLEFTDDANVTTYERAEWLTPVRLRRIFGAHLKREFFVDDPEKTESQRVASVVARKGDFVAGVDPQERLQGLIDRRAILERLSPQLARLIRED